MHLFEILDISTWPLDKIILPWLEGEEMVRKFYEILKFQVDVKDFHDFVDTNIQLKNVQLPNSILSAKNIISTISISSLEAKRDFSPMNFIVLKSRTSLTMEHISNVMTINLLGKPIVNFDVLPFLG